MSPLPGWLTGSQSVALNMSNNDVPIQLHFALFNGSPGFILKPLEMRDAPEAALSSSIPEPRTPVGPIARRASERISLERPSTPGHVAEQETRTDYWPPSREHLHCASISVASNDHHWWGAGHGHTLTIPNSAALRHRPILWNRPLWRSRSRFIPLEASVASAVRFHCRKPSTPN